MHHPSLPILHALFHLAKAHRPTTLAALAHVASVPLSTARTSLLALEREGYVWLVAGGPRLTMMGLAATMVSMRVERMTRRTTGESTAPGLRSQRALVDTQRSTLRAA